MTREELLKSKEYWVAGMQIIIFEAVSKYMEENNLTKDELALKLNSNKMAYDILHGDFSGTMSDFVSILIMCGKVPLVFLTKLNSPELEERIKEMMKNNENN